MSQQTTKIAHLAMCCLGSVEEPQYSDQWHFSPTFSNCVSLSTRLLALSSLPKQQKKRTKPLRLRKISPSSSVSLLDWSEVEDTGLRGMVAFAKMSESRLRCRVCGVVCSDGLARVSEDEDGVEAWAWNVVSSGCSI